MNTHRLSAIAFSVALALSASASAGSIEPRAEQLLRQMNDTLAAQSAISFTTFERHEEPGSDDQLEARRVLYRKPNHIRVDTASLGVSRTVRFDGKQFMLTSDAAEVYASAPSPETTVDGLLDYLALELGVNQPFADVLYASPYDAYVGPETSGRYVGLEEVDGVSCHRLAMQGTNVEWDIWITDRANPVPRKLAIRYNGIPGKPRSFIYYHHWKLDPDLDMALFDTTPPEGYVKVQLLDRSAALTARKSDKARAQTKGTK